MKALLLLSFVAVAVVADFSLGEMFAQLDKNQDGYIDQREVESAFRMSPELAQTMVNEADANKDNRVSVDEAAQFLEMKGSSVTIPLTYLSRLAVVHHKNEQLKAEHVRARRMKRQQHMMERAAPSMLLEEEQHRHLQHALQSKSNSPTADTHNTLADTTSTTTTTKSNYDAVSNNNMVNDVSSLGATETPNAPTTSPAKSDSDSTATQCGVNQWSTTGTTPCTPCDQCGDGQVVFSQCLPTANVVCKKCHDGNCCDSKTGTFWADGIACGHIAGQPTFAQEQVTVNGVCQLGVCILTATADVQ